MKLYDLKLKEIKVLEKKIHEEKANLANNPHHGRKISKKKKKTIQLKKKLHQEKAHVKQTVKKVVGQHSNLIVNDYFNKIIESYLSL